MKKNKGFVSIGMLIVIIVASLVVGGGATYYATRNSNNVVVDNSQKIPQNNYQIKNEGSTEKVYHVNDNQISATNNAENTPVNTNNINSSVSMTLPQYMGTYENGWPPVIQTSSVAYSCMPSVGTGDVPTAVTQKTINSKKYCVSSFVDCGAGSCGGNYTYKKENGTGIKTATFKLRWVSCGGYGASGDSQYDACKANQKTFFDNLDILISGLM